MKRKNKNTIDAQMLKRRLELAAKKLGRKKRINIGQAFLLVCESANETDC